MPKVIFISGASRGIGRALAHRYAKPGAHLILTARNEEKLKEVSHECRNQGATTLYKAMDLRETEPLKNFILEIDANTPIDLMIANAGVATTLQPNWQPETEEDLQTSLMINLFGTFNTINPIIHRMMTRKHGQIAIMSSLASMRGLPQSPSYCATKAALRIYGQSLRAWLALYHVNINVICPGYVTTDMSNQLSGPKPFLISTEKASKIIQKGLEKNKACIAFPWQLHALMKLANTLPASMVNPILRQFESYARFKDQDLLTKPCPLHRTDQDA